MPIPFVLAAVLAGISPDSLAAPVIAAENGFAADATRFGVRLAFLAHFDADSWLFRPHPVAALAALAHDPDSGSPLEWAPEIAGVAASGDMGFTSGPWSAHAPGVERMAHGHFLTVWKRADDGIWRVQVDGGVSHPPLAQPAGAVKVIASAGSSPAAPIAPGDLAQRRRLLETGDDALRDALGNTQTDPATMWRAIADPDLRILRPGHSLTAGNEAFELVAQDPRGRGNGPRRALDLAASGDLAYTIGGDAGCKTCGSYYRVWRWHEKGWRLLIDLETP